MNPRNNSFAIFASIISLSFLLSGVWLGAFFQKLAKEENAPQISFDSVEWKTMNATERYKMYDDLVENYAVIGKTYTEIIDLLGDYEGKYDPDGNPENKNYYLYYTIRYDIWDGDEVILLHFEDDILENVEKEKLSYL